MKKYHDKTTAPDDLFWVRFAQSGLTRRQAAALCGVDRTTFARWETGQSRIPKAAFQLISFIAAGTLPPVAGAAWQGWMIKNGRLYAPNGWAFTPGELLTVPLLHSLARKAGADYFKLFEPPRNAKSAP